MMVYEILPDIEIDIETFVNIYLQPPKYRSSGITIEYRIRDGTTHWYEPSTEEYTIILQEIRDIVNKQLGPLLISDIVYGLNMMIRRGDTYGY